MHTREHTRQITVGGRKIGGGGGGFRIALSRPGKGPDERGAFSDRVLPGGLYRSVLKL